MLVSAQHKALVFPWEHADAIFGAIPHAVGMVSNGEDYVVVPHKVDETIVLRNLGFNAPAPIESQYDWPHYPGEPPFPHQRTSAAFLTLNKRAFNLSEFRTGKTNSGYWAADFLMRQAVIRKVLVVAPLSTLEDTHGRALHFNFPHRTFAVLHGTAETRRRLLRADFDFYLINFEGLGTVLKEIGAREDIDLIIIDECAKARDGSRTRWKWLHKIIKPRMYVWGYTGAPTPNEPPEAYAQVRLINPSMLAQYPSYRSFQMATMRKVTMFKWEAKTVKHDGIDAQTLVHEIMQPSIRYTKDQCFTMPPLTISTQSVELTAGQKTAYKEMMKTFVTEIGTGQITALNEAVKLTKLMQIVSGVVYDQAGKHQTLDCKPRLDAVLEIIEAAATKTIILVPFKGNVSYLVDALTKAGLRVVAINGDTPKTARRELFADFREPNGADVMVAHPEVMAHGLDVTAADTIVYWCPYDRPEIYQQASERIQGPRQKHKMSIIQLAATPIERAAYLRLERKQKMQGVLLEMVKLQTT